MIFARSLTALSLFLVLLPHVAEAQVVITEIMYDLAEGSDSGREWVEIYAAASTDLTKLKLIENGSNHKIAAEASALIPMGAYAVIADNPAKFRNDYPSYAGFLFDSAFNLNNDGESITIADAAGNPIDTVHYTNASGNGTGDSLQRSPGSNQFDAGIPTPGLGIPSSGLARSTPPQKASKKTAPPPTQKIEIVGKSDFPSSSPFIAAAATSSLSWMWWCALFLFAGFAGAGISLSRHFKKDEWEIIEEIEETS